MSLWGRWLQRREQRRRAALLEQLALDIADEVARQVRTGGVSLLVASDVIRGTLLEAVRVGWGPSIHDAPGRPWTSEAMRRLVRDVASTEMKALDVRLQDSPEPIEVRARRYQEWLEREQERESARQAAVDATARRRRAEEAAPRWLAEAGLPAGPTEVKITTLLLLQNEDLTEVHVRNALKAFEDAYERRVRSSKDSGGQTAWPTADSVIASLFERP